MSWVTWFAIVSVIFFISVKIAEKILVKSKKVNEKIDTNFKENENDNEIKED